MNQAGEGFFNSPPHSKNLNLKKNCRHDTSMPHCHKKELPC